MAAILIFMMLAPEYPGMRQAVGIVLAITVAADFLVMLFSRVIMKTPGLMPALQLLGAALIFMQAALAVETILKALKHLGVIWT